MYTGLQQISSQQINSVNAFKDTSSSLGDLAISSDQCIYAYAQAGAVNLAAGKMNVTPAKVANNQNLALDTTSLTAVGSTMLNLVLGGTAVTQNQYIDGYLVVNDGTGVGQEFQIAGNSAQTSTTGVVSVQLTDGLVTALDSTSKVSLMPNAHSNTIVHPGASGAFFSNGMSNAAVPATYYYWSQVRGMASVLSDGVIAKGAGAILTTNSVPGAVLTEATGTILQRVGIAPEATIDTKYYGIFLTLA